MTPKPTPAEVAQALRDAVEHDTPTHGPACLALAHLLDATGQQGREDTLTFKLRQLQEELDETRSVLAGVVAVVRELPADLDEVLGLDLWNRLDALGDL